MSIFDTWNSSDKTVDSFIKTAKNAINTESAENILQFLNDTQLNKKTTEKKAEHIRKITAGITLLLSSFKPYSIENFIDDVLQYDDAKNYYSDVLRFKFLQSTLSYIA